MDWLQCPDVEQIPGKVSGAWIVKGTRVQADAILENADAGCSVEEIGNELFPGVGVDRVRRLLAFAKHHETHPA